MKDPQNTGTRLHYTRELLIARALNLSDLREQNAPTEDIVEALVDLDEAGHNYRIAVFDANLIANPS